MKTIRKSKKLLSIKLINNKNEPLDSIGRCTTVHNLDFAELIKKIKETIACIFFQTDVDESSTANAKIVAAAPENIAGLQEKKVRVGAAERVRKCMIFIKCHSTG